ncbi:MAG: adenylate/guanylate cyclase domain-containing protein [Nocardioidaceae bacterium]|nr:adenylate/guanylate cyclase domain-containing protein [Nocardioidaceae bacterium]
MTDLAPGHTVPDEGSHGFWTAVVVTALVLPLLGLVLLLSQPALDLHWEHHPSHFWLVLGTAVVAAVLAYATGAAAVLRGDARVLFVSLSFLSASGFLGLHALATPGVLLSQPNAGFVVATPVGIALGSVFAAWSTIDRTGDRAVAAVRLGRGLRLALLALMAVWALASVSGLPPLSGSVDRVERLPVVLAVPAIVLYGYAAVRYLALWRARGAPMLVAMMAAFLLLGEAMVAISFARNWHLSWWEWHLLMLAAFALVAVGAQHSWREERFAPVYSEETLRGRRDVSVLFADLQGFTTYSEAHRPEEVTAMLNAYFHAAVPAVVAPYGGEVDRIIGDALMVTFNKNGNQPDHAHRAAAAGLAMQQATRRVADAHEGWPRFRVGINSGPATVSVLGTGGGRTHTVIGDTVNTASRIEGKAPAGGVAISAATRDLLPDALTAPLGSLELKGKTEPVETYLLLAMSREGSA